MKNIYLLTIDWATSDDANTAVVVLVCNRRRRESEMGRVQEGHHERSRICSDLKF